MRCFFSHAASLAFQAVALPLARPSLFLVFKNMQEKHIFFPGDVSYACTHMKIRSAEVFWCLVGTGQKQLRQDLSTKPEKRCDVGSAEIGIPSTDRDPAPITLRFVGLH